MDLPPEEPTPVRPPTFEPSPVGSGYPAYGYDYGNPASPSNPAYPGQDYGYGNGHPYAYPSYGLYDPYGTPVGTNGLAKASFILSILGFFGVTAVLGVVFGGLAVGQTKRTGQRGRGFAVTGLTLGTAWLALFGTFIAVAVATAKDPAVRDAKGTVVKAGQVALFDLRPGDCFIDPNASRPAPKGVDSVTAQPCRSVHDAEAFATPAASATAGSDATPGAGAYPGTAALQADAKAACKTALADYVYDDLSIPRSVRSVFYVPDAKAWAAGKRRFLCSLESKVNLTRSLREDDSVLTADQARYLKAVGEFNRQVELIDDTDRSADLATWHRLAADMAAIAAREDTALTGTWPPGVQRAVDRLVAQQARAIPMYQLAAHAATPEDAQLVLDRALSYIDSDDAVTVRSALGLSTIQGQAPNTGTEILYG